jgi:hypothetical protein
MLKGAYEDYNWEFEQLYTTIPASTTVSTALPLLLLTKMCENDSGTYCSLQRSTFEWLLGSSFFINLSTQFLTLAHMAHQAQNDKSGLMWTTFRKWVAGIH